MIRMIEKRLERPMEIRRHRLVLAIALLASFATFGVASPALAKTKKPSKEQEEWAVFADCPVHSPGVNNCIVSRTIGGEFTLGKKTVAINKTILLQGGLAGSSAALVAAADGNTLSKTTLTVPGGLVGVGELGGEVTATAEIAGPASSVLARLGPVLTGSGTAVTLPLKVKLDNPFLGPECYVGTDSEPIVLELTTGTTSPPGPNKPISGNPGTVTFTGKGNSQILHITGSSLVDNAFSVPGASGCGGLLSLVIDPLVDVIAGVPAAAGSNTAILNGTLEQAPAKAVIKHDKL